MEVSNNSSLSYEQTGGLGPSGPITWDDATWILTSSFIIFTMQSGFGLLEAGSVSGKNEVNIMMKNVVDVVFGGVTYWAFGYGFSFGQDEGSNPFCGFGSFFVDTHGDDMGLVYSTFVFQLSFATTATTVVSGAMAERTKLMAYMIFSVFNTVVYCFPAHWVWGHNGFLRDLGVVDFAGAGVVHLVGGASSLVAAAFLKPRIGRFDEGKTAPPMNNPAGAIVGMFMLWWGWLAFNCGSTFGISGGKWKLAAKSAVTTLISSFSGGIVGIGLSFVVYKKKYDVAYMINSVLGALVSITACCALVRPWEALVIGMVGGFCTIFVIKITEIAKIDDPVGAIGVHGGGGLWGLIAVGIFAAEDSLEQLTYGRAGLTHGGGFYLLGVQTLCIVCEVFWSGLVTFIILFAIDKIIGLRMSAEDELLGSDLVEHNVGEWPNTNSDSKEENEPKEKIEDSDKLENRRHSLLIGDSGWSKATRLYRDKRNKVRISSIKEQLQSSSTSETSTNRTLQVSLHL
ncbi:hypothetical protein LOTGIDRAFT_102290 [Lottia gigantea]|uniref:Ammonium transporter n=1 Tax=Lottia gigantea TaxID=225164 RepID=V4CRP5_LOTGI|nr:hypothetical protein LOTGIDRAFT_102290 [Lottia gigantea]ESP05195.1 hypothetical protein LOTGIDRAFT_102290 [Lottia gigantea]